MYSTRQAFPGGAVGKNLPASAGDTGSIPGPGSVHKLWSNWNLCPNYRAHGSTPGACVLPREKPLQEALAPRWEPATQQRRPSTTKNKYVKFLIKK